MGVAVRSLDRLAICLGHRQTGNRHWLAPQGLPAVLDMKGRHGQPGRPAVSKEIRQLIRKMSRENPLWGAPRIHGEWLKLGIDIGETGVGKYIVRSRKPPSQTWRTFLENHVKTMVSVDFF